jgi:hypothetical protein
MLSCLHWRLNSVRFNSFANLITAARNLEEDVSLGSKAAQDIAKTVNDVTGRGNIGWTTPSELY